MDIKPITTDLKNITKTTKAPELQFHVAASLVAAGDPFSLDVTKKQDKVGEVCQFCVVVPAEYVGRLKVAHIENAFLNLMLSTIKKLRESGVMAQGE